MRSDRTSAAVSRRGLRRLASIPVFLSVMAFDCPPPETSEVKFFPCDDDGIPVGVDLRGVAGQTRTHFMIVGDQGTMLRHEDACDFRLIPIPVDVVLNAIWMEDTDTWVVGGDAESGGVILRGSTLWEETSEFFNSVWASEPCDVFFGGVGIATDFPNAMHYDCSDTQSLMIDIGWSEVTGISGTAGTDVWAVLNQPTFNLWHYDGTSWENRSEQWMDQPLYSVSAISTGEVFAVGAAGTIYYFDGSAWVDQSPPGLNKDLYGVWAGTEFGSFRAVAVGADATAYGYDGSWHPIPVSGSSEALRGVWGVHADAGDPEYFSGHDLFIAVGDNGTVVTLHIEIVDFMAGLP